MIKKIKIRFWKFWYITLGHEKHLSKRQWKKLMKRWEDPTGDKETK